MYHRRNDRYAHCCALERDRFGGGGSVMVWAAIVHGYRSPLVVTDVNLNAQRYRDDILAHHVIPLFHNNANISIFQHDNATSHRARDTVHFLRTNNIDFIDDWPDLNPDLNPIVQFLLTYGHDFCTKRCIMEHSLNAYITIIPPVCYHQVMFKQS